MFDLQVIDFGYIDFIGEKTKPNQRIKYNQTTETVIRLLK